MWTQTRVRPPLELLGRDRVVEVARGDGVDRERRQVAQVAAARARRAGCSRASSAARSTPGGNERRRPRSSISASITSRATSGEPSTRTTLARAPPRSGLTSASSPGRASCGARPIVTRRPRSKKRLADEEPRAALEQHDGRRPACAGCVLVGAGTARWTVRASSRPPAPPVAAAARERRRAGACHVMSCAGSPPRARPCAAPARASSACGVFGVVAGDDVRLQAGAGLDAAAAEVAALGREVLAGGDVERAAVGELDHLLEDALAERPRADELRAPAVLQRAGDDLRRRGGAAVDEHDERRLGDDGSPVALSVRSGTLRPRVVTIGPSSRNALATSCASSTRPPPLPRRSST